MTRRILVPLYLAACLLLGGASAAGYGANLVLQLAALPLIGWAAWQLWTTGPQPQARVPLLLIAALVLVFLLQLIPLPPSVWTMLPGRAMVADGYRALGVPLPWLPLSLTPDGSLASLLWLLPAIAVLLLVVVSGAFRSRWIALAIVAVTLASVLLGAVQVIGGEGSPAYFYRITNHNQAVGFFANSNHNATLLLVSIPFLAALATTFLREARSSRNASAIRLVVGATYAVLFVGLLINSSLAGIGLGVPVALLTWVAFGRQRPTVARGLAIVTLLASAAALATIVIGPFGNNLFGEQRENVELSRRTSFHLTLRAAGDFLPFGSGIGSFQPVYRTQEPLASVTTTYMNHAHSDWLELLLETGVVGLALAAAFLAWWVARVRATWLAPERDLWGRAAAIATGAMILHSAVDYPLRTAALSAVFAACVGILSGVRPYVRRSGEAASTRHLSL